MPWPSSRLTTYTPATPVKSNDLNRMQDAIVAGQHGDREFSTAAVAACVIEAAWVPNSGGWLQSAGIGRAWYTPPLRPGDRLKTLTFSRYGDGVTDFAAVQVYRLTAAGIATILMGVFVDNPPAAWADTVIDVPDSTLLTGEAFFVEFVASGSNLRIGTIRGIYDRP